MCGIFGVFLADKLGEIDLERVISSVNLNGRALAESGALAAGLVYYGLYNLQNRGQDSTGIVVLDNGELRASKGSGMVVEAYSQKKLEELVGNIASGHNRYSTTGELRPENIQPFSVDFPQKITLAHNGNIINKDELRDIVEEESERFGLKGRITIKTTTDSELLLNLIALSVAKGNSTIEDAIVSGLKPVVGSYSLVITTNNTLIGVRDRHENRPLYVAKIAGSYFFSSEERVIKELMYIGNYRQRPTDMVLEVKGGQIIVISKFGTKYPIKIITLGKSEGQEEQEKLFKCSFSDSYLKRDDEKGVYQFRKRTGQALFNEHPIKKSEDIIVVGVSGSGLIAAEGYSSASGIPMVHGIRRDRYFQKRTFIEPYQHGRAMGALMKYYAISDALEDKVAVLVDDSIVRATTSSNLIKMMRLRGNVREIHMRVATPPYITPCWLGIHTPEKKGLIANGLTLEQVELFFSAMFFGVDYEMNALKDIVKKESNIKKIVGQSILDQQNYLTDEERGPVDKKRFSLKYLGLDKFKECFREQKENMCYACFIPDGNGYPKYMQPHLLGKV